MFIIKLKSKKGMTVGLVIGTISMAVSDERIELFCSYYQPILFS